MNDAANEGAEALVGQGAPPRAYSSSAEVAQRRPARCIGGRGGRAIRDRTRSRGLTLIEILISLGIVALVTSMAVIGISSVTDAQLRSSAVEMAGAMKQSYDRAIMQHRTQRVVFDIDKNSWWMEFSESPFATSKEKMRGEEGTSDEVKEAEKDKKKSRWDKEEKSQVEALLEGGSAAFVPDVEIDGGKPTRLPGDVHLKRVWTSHQEEAFTTGTAYLHFWKSGMAEAALIELEDDGGDIVTLEVQPLTGRVRTYPKRMPVPDLGDDDDGRKDGDE